MGKVMSIIGRKLNRFNIESRTEKILERDKPTAAPKFKSTIFEMERALESDPQLVEKLNKKDLDLHDRLKSVYVTSEIQYLDSTRTDAEKSEKGLPMDRSNTEDFEYGFKEPTKLTPGRCTLRQAMKFITDHQIDPIVWSASKIAEEYKLKEQLVGNILLHFKTFQVYTPNIDASTKRNFLEQAKSKLIADKN